MEPVLSAVHNACRSGALIHPRLTTPDTSHHVHILPHAHAHACTRTASHGRRTVHAAASCDHATHTGPSPRHADRAHSESHPAAHAHANRVEPAHHAHPAACHGAVRRTHAVRHASVHHGHVACAGVVHEGHAGTHQSSGPCGDLAIGETGGMSLFVALAARLCSLYFDLCAVSRHVPHR